MEPVETWSDERLTRVHSCHARWVLINRSLVDDPRKGDAPALVAQVLAGYETKERETAAELTRRNLPIPDPLPLPAA